MQFQLSWKQIKNQLAFFVEDNPKKKKIIIFFIFLEHFRNIWKHIVIVCSRCTCRHITVSIPHKLGGLLSGYRPYASNHTHINRKMSIMSWSSNPQKNALCLHTEHCLFMLVANYLRAFITKLTLMLSTRASISAKTFSIAVVSAGVILPSKIKV